MAVTKIYDACVKTGEYNGKALWDRVGSVMKDEKGSNFMLLKKHFNPAGIDSNSDSILIALFEPKPKDV